MKQPGPADLLLMRGQYNFKRAVRVQISYSEEQDLFYIQPEQL